MGFITFVLCCCVSDEKEDSWNHELYEDEPFTELRALETIQYKINIPDGGTLSRCQSKRAVMSLQIQIYKVRLTEITVLYEDVCASSHFLKGSFTGLGLFREVQPVYCRRDSPKEIL